jgi:hypothetical protein
MHMCYVSHNDQTVACIKKQDAIFRLEVLIKSTKVCIWENSSSEWDMGQRDVPWLSVTEA